MNLRRNGKKAMHPRPVLLLTLALLAGSAGAQSIAASCSQEGVRDARASFNAAIGDGDLGTVAQLLAEDVVLITGTNSDLFVGKAAQLELWAADFSEPDSLSYLRTPKIVEVSPLHDIALETGLWTGAAANGDEVGGSYSAKWRCDNKTWLLEAELFMTTRCTGTLCE